MRQIVALQRVLILRVGHPAADAKVLHRLHVETDAGDFCRVFANPRDDFLRAESALAQRLERDEGVRGVGRAVTTGERERVVDRRILVDHFDNLHQPIVHCLERGVLISQHRAHQAAGVLLGKKSLRNDLRTGRC